MKATGIIATLAMALTVSAAWAQRSAPPTKAELAKITERGRLLAAYDEAAWHSTDAVMATHPPEGSFTRYIAMQADRQWVVVFGRLNAERDKFLIVYEATPTEKEKAFAVQKHDPPKEDTAFFFYAAKAIETAIGDFRGENRPYNVAVLPDDSGQIFVYVVPAQTARDVYPLGGDVRYLVSADGGTILEKRQLHKSILEIAPSRMPGSTIAGGFHTHILDDIPEDTDVFHVLRKKPPVPEYISSARYSYEIQTDGTIKYLRETKKRSK